MSTGNCNIFQVFSWQRQSGPERLWPRIADCSAPDEAGMEQPAAFGPAPADARGMCIAECARFMLTRCGMGSICYN